MKRLYLGALLGAIVFGGSSFAAIVPPVEKHGTVYTMLLGFAPVNMNNSGRMAGLYTPPGGGSSYPATWKEGEAEATRVGPDGAGPAVMNDVGIIGYIETREDGQYAVRVDSAGMPAVPDIKVPDGRIILAGMDKTGYIKATLVRPGEKRHRLDIDLYAVTISDNEGTDYLSPSINSWGEYGWTEKKDGRYEGEFYQMNSHIGDGGVKSDMAPRSGSDVLPRRSSRMANPNVVALGRKAALDGEEVQPQTWFVGMGENYVVLLQFTTQNDVTSWRYRYPDVSTYRSGFMALGTNQLDEAIGLQDGSELVVCSADMSTYARIVIPKGIDLNRIGNFTVKGEFLATTWQGEPVKVSLS
jgi:hypothetical protein